MSSVSSVGSTDISSLLSSLSGTRKKKGGGKMEEDFDSLQKALDSGNLTDAKSALSTIQTAFQNGPGGKSADASSTSSVSGTSSAGKGPDLTTLQKAIDSGDLSAAKTALADLKKNAPKGPPPKGGAGGKVDGTSETDETNSIEDFLKALESSSSSSSSSSTSSTISADATGNMGNLLDLLAD